VSRIDETFSAAKKAEKKVLVAFVSIGDPSVEASTEIAIACAESGADILELGVPFSDPIADGPVIARASARALKAGVSLARVLEAAKAIRSRVPTPLVLFSYYNPIFTYGAARLVDDAAAAGIDAFLVVDLPPEEAADLRDAADARGMAMIPLLSPTTTDARAARTLARAKGFVYYVSLTGVTGAAAAPLADASIAAAKLREKGGLPVVVGFGIDSPEKARAAAGANGAGADGVVVGTAIVKTVETSTTTEEARTRVAALVKSIRAGLDG
jgi:tryptophan synthase alpha chain